MDTLYLGVSTILRPFFRSYLNNRTNQNTSLSGKGKADVRSAKLTELFQKVDSDKDSKDCSFDCDTCTIKYPRGFDINYDDDLYGGIDEWATHILIATGKSDWTFDIADDKNSVMQNLSKMGPTLANGTMKVSASNIPLPDIHEEYATGDRPTTVLVLPSLLFIDNVTPQNVGRLVHSIVSQALTTTSPLQMNPPLKNPEEMNTLDISGSDGQLDFKSYPCTHSAVVLLCSQRTRDARCGQSAPLLKKEFERHLRPLGLARDIDDRRPGGVGIYFVSHVGGHKYSANVIIYRRRDSNLFRSTCEAHEQTSKIDGASQGIWLARVRPQDCEAIVKYTVLEGKVIKPEKHLRGGFNRETGYVSW